MSSQVPLIVVSQDANEYLEKNKLSTQGAQVIPFTASMHLETDRNRLIAFLHSENYKLTRVIHN